jgi:thymidylate kinase
MPRIIMKRRGEEVMIVTNPHCNPPRSAVTSIAKIVMWLMEEWYATLFQEKRNTLILYDRYYHDLLIDPLRYRYGGPAWAARLVGHLMPQPALWVLLDAPAEVLQSRKQEVPPEETARQRKAYLDFVCKQHEHRIVDTSQSLKKVIADVEQAISGLVIGNVGNCG